MRSGRIIASLALALMMLLPGCLEEVASTEQEVDTVGDHDAHEEKEVSDDFFSFTLGLGNE